VSSGVRRGPSGVVVTVAAIVASLVAAAMVTAPG
jgi:hypothetical protein